MDFCVFSAINDFSFDAKWVMNRGVKMQEVYLPDLDKPLRQQFLQHLKSSSTESVIIDLSGYKDCSTILCLNQQFILKIVGADLDNVLIDLCTFGPDLKRFELGSQQRFNFILSDSTFKILCIIVKASKQLQSFRLVCAYKLPGYLIETLCSASNVEEIHLGGCALAENAHIDEVLSSCTNNNVRHFMCSSDAARLAAVFPSLQTITAERLHHPSTLSVALQSCPLVTTATLDFVHLEPIDDLVKTIHGHWLGLQMLCVTVYGRRVSLPEASVLQFITNYKSLVAIAPPLNTIVMCPTQYPLHYTGSRLLELSVYCEDTATLVAIVTQCPYLHTLYLERKDHEFSTSTCSTSYVPVEHASHCEHSYQSAKSQQLHDSY